MPAPELARLTRRVDAHDEDLRVLSDLVVDIKETVDHHSELLAGVSTRLDHHTEVLDHHTEVLGRHTELLTEILARLDRAG